MPVRRPARALITGIAGQDGSYLAEQLLDEGLEVHALALAGEVPDQPRPPYCPDGVHLHYGDITDQAATEALLREVSPEEIYHLAALSSVALSWEQPELVRAVNAEAAIGLMESALRLRADGVPVRFLQASSAEIFGQPTLSPQDESTPIAPVNPYGEAKAAAHLAVAEARERGLPATSVILYNHESPRRDLRFVTRKISSTIAAIATGRADSLVLGNLDARRDWGWAPDYVRAMVAALRHDPTDDFVIATGLSRSVRDFVAAAFAHVGISDWERYVSTDPAFFRPVDAVELVGDSSRARAELGWEPSVTFDAMVAAMVDADLALVD